VGTAVLEVHETIDCDRIAGAVTWSGVEGRETDEFSACAEVIRAESQDWYYLIDLDAGRTILKCPGGPDQASTWDIASRHLRIIRAQLGTRGQIGPVMAHPDGLTATLVGVYRPYTPDEERFMPKSYGYTPNLFGSIDTDPDEWERVK
jgi:hypothetical protein